MWHDRPRGQDDCLALCAATEIMPCSSISAAGWNRGRLLDSSPHLLRYYTCYRPQADLMRAGVVVVGMTGPPGRQVVKDMVLDMTGLTGTKALGWQEEGRCNLEY
jgi:hypothetical protein